MGKGSPAGLVISQAGDTREIRLGLALLMRGEKFKDGCKGCDRSREIDNAVGGIVRLDGRWMLNHYQDKEQGFLSGRSSFTGKQGSRGYTGLDNGYQEPEISRNSHRSAHLFGWASLALETLSIMSGLNLKEAATF